MKKVIIEWPLVWDTLAHSGYEMVKEIYPTMTKEQFKEFRANRKVEIEIDESEDYEEGNLH